MERHEAWLEYRQLGRHVEAAITWSERGRLMRLQAVAAIRAAKVIEGEEKEG